MLASALCDISTCRNGSFYARLSVEDGQGRKKLAWVPLDVQRVAQEQEEVRRLLVERADNTLRHIGAAPNLEDYYFKTYLPFLVSAGKKPGTVVTEKGHLQDWRRGLGHLRLDRIRPTRRVLARRAADLPGFGFHDCRHFLISHAVMAGVDFMTIAKWVGHRDGGLLIGKVTDTYPTLTRAVRQNGRSFHEWRLAA